ncbi:MAG: PKD domain-containing protein, partial [Bacteroidota bacterium]|nr:PKD domain-containing protein [Bacteroidota bacterium]
FTPKAIIKFKDGRICVATLAKPVIIYGNPVADFNVSQNEQITLCRRGDKFCFTDKSRAGPDGASPVSWLWDFGDGQSSTDRNPCYSYNDSGSFRITLKIIDSNGCQHIRQRDVRIKFSGDLGIDLDPQFISRLTYDCIKNLATLHYTNTTDTAGKFITKFTWDFGDGTTLNCDLTDTACRIDWAKQQRTYSQTGLYYPTLYVENKYGCTASFTLDTGVYVSPYEFKVEVLPATNACHATDSIITFQAAPHPYASYYIWDFGDPDKPDNGVLPFTMHSYSNPGTYHVRMQTKIVDCIYDTCIVINLQGPQALIMPHKKGLEGDWDVIPKHGDGRILPEEMAGYFDTSCYPPDTASYFKYTKTLLANGDTTWNYCKVTDTLGYDSIVYYRCGTGPGVIKNYKLAFDYVVEDTMINVAEQYFWQRGDPLPDTPVYRSKPFKNRPLWLDDTTLFHCSGTVSIAFTNFSTKYRSHTAVDDQAPSYPPGTCNNPSYPYASDSLTYAWDFKEGDGTTSTEALPDPYSRFSLEKLPTHIYRKNGCYWVHLVVTDPITGCEDLDSIPVVMQQPDAGWAPEYSGINNMTWLKQQSLDPDGPRRGFRLDGPPCLNIRQRINVNETLPSCYKEEYWVVLDSAKNRLPTCDTSMARFAWTDKKGVEKMQKVYTYRDTGWVTVAMAVRSADCYDTVWYHNYKYIHGLYPGVGVNKSLFCVGETARLHTIIPNQPGIKRFTLKFVVEREKFDTVAVYRDTFAQSTIVKG